MARQREDDRTTTLCGEAAFCYCGSVSIGMLNIAFAIIVNAPLPNLFRGPQVQWHPRFVQIRSD